MSNTYAKIVSGKKLGFPEESSFLDITAFVGDGKAIQLTTKLDYITLTEKQVKDLINILKARLDSKVTATGDEELGTFFPSYEEQNQPNVSQEKKN